jgi:hypothetical protein
LYAETSRLLDRDLLVLRLVRRAENPIAGNESEKKGTPPGLLALLLNQRRNLPPMADLQWGEGR